MAPGSYAHDSHGVNIANLRSIALGGTARPSSHGVPPIALELLRQPSGARGGGIGGEAELSARLRHSGALARAAAAQQVEAQLRSVEEAIHTKLRKTRDISAARAVDCEMAAMARCHQRLRSADAHLRSQLGLNEARQEVRGKVARPRRAQSGVGAASAAAAQLLAGPPVAAGAAVGRSAVGLLLSSGGGGGGAGSRPSSAAPDEVARQLHHQRLLLDGLLERAGRAERLVAAAGARLAECRARLGADLWDKGQALSIDEAVLGMHGVGSGGGDRRASDAAAAPAGPPAAGSAAGGVFGGATAAAVPPAWAAGGSPGGRRRWEGDSSTLVAGAQQLVAESGRLRAKVKQTLLDLSAAVVGSARAVDSSISDRIRDTRAARAALQERLREVEAEAARAGQEQESLRRSIEEKRAPLEQLRARFDLRRRRPAREAVADEVESALAAEAAGLAAVARQLERHEAAVGAQAAALREAAAALRPGIEARAEEAEVEELAARLDGRDALESPRAPSIISVCASTVLSGYSQLGDSASQACAPSLHNWPAAAAQRGAARGAAPAPPQPRGGGSRAGASPAPSAVSSGAVRGAVARIAALERELAEAKLQTTHLEEELREVKQQQQQQTAAAGIMGSRGGSVLSAATTARGGGAAAEAARSRPATAAAAAAAAAARPMTAAAAARLAAARGGAQA
ncbi:hypothetical protein Rsub_02050 [Raphidocelis subcapitata]|uniref:Uncharacterized protein n=1 Tax=Raphidocelis subcapitata TaxID=307507 RepID=A0A2V0NPD4_9CHLO|nr:hypothetical protein Rsub_02050 [Raphidocelis subcapitata]|eukprot:GBF89478.1 hypothetical protein Rsub_02050 [Raphidocelis subcapitata]